MEYIFLKKKNIDMFRSLRKNFILNGFPDYQSLRPLISLLYICEYIYKACFKY